MAFYGVDTTSTTLEIVRDTIVATGNAGWSNDWLVGLEILSVDCIWSVFSVCQPGRAPASHSTAPPEEPVRAVLQCTLHVEERRTRDGCRWEQDLLVLCVWRGRLFSTSVISQRTSLVDGLL